MKAMFIITIFGYVKASQANQWFPAKPKTILKKVIWKVDAIIGKFKKS